MPKDTNNTSNSDFDAEFFKNFNKNIFSAINNESVQNNDTKNNQETKIQSTKDVYPNNFPMTTKSDEKRRKSKQSFC